MDYKKLAEESIDKTKELVSDIENLKNAGVSLIDKIIVSYASEIIQCETEQDFLKFLTEVGDLMYKGNIIIETLDGIVIKKILEFVDKIILDKFFGADWFVKIRTKAEKVLENKNGIN